MRRLGTLYVTLSLALLFGGCAHTLGYAGAHPGYVKGKGKGSITATGAGNVSVGYGGSELNSFTLQADCGPDGFEFSQGKMPDIAPMAPAPAK